MYGLRVIIVRAQGVLFKTVLEIFNDLSMASIGRCWQGISSEIRRVRYMRGFLDVHGCIEKLSHFAKRPLLKRIFQSGRVFEHKKPAFRQCVPQVIHEPVTVSLKIKPIYRGDCAMVV